MVHLKPGQHFSHFCRGPRKTNVSRRQILYAFSSRYICDILFDKIFKEIVKKIKPKWLTVNSDPEIVNNREKQPAVLNGPFTPGCQIKHVIQMNYIQPTSQK